MTSQHPPGLVLSQYVDGELPADRREDVSRHLGHCDECRETVDFYRRLSAAAGEPREVTVPDVADRVLRRRRDVRASGDRTLASGDAQNGARRRLAMAASVAAALLIGSYLVLAPSATAHRSSLRFETTLPRPGDVVDVEYSPSTLLADRDSLRLRIRARSAETPFPRQGIIGELRTATLHRNDAGRFKGQVEVRPGDVYLAAAVEDFEGEGVDTNLGRLWDVLVADSSGQPTTAALESRYRVLEPNNWVAASAWASEAAAEYPENPFGWTLLYVHQSRAGSLPLSDSLSRFHQRKLAELTRGQQGKTTDELKWLVLYAELQGSEAVHQALLTELTQLDPDQPAVVNARIRQMLRDCGDDRACRLQELDAIWRGISRPVESLAQLGLATAVLAEDKESARQWISRARQAPEVRLPVLADMLGPLDQAAVERSELRRAHIAELTSLDDSDRPLRLSGSEYRQQVAGAVRSARAKLAADLAIAGDTTEALKTFAAAAEDAWEPDILRPYVDLLVSIGDTASAVPLIGLLIADPLEGQEIEDAYRSIRPPEDELDQLREEYHRRVLNSAVLGRRLPQQTSLSGRGDESLRAGDLAGSPIVFFLWEPDLPRADEWLQDFGLVDERLWTARGIQRLILTHAPGPLRLEDGPMVIRDPEFELSQRLGAYGTPSYVVLGPDLTVVAQTADVSKAFRIASALSTTAK